MNVHEIRKLVKKHGANGFVKHYVEPLLEGRELPNGAKYKKRPEDFSIKALYEAQYEENLLEAIDSTMFPKVTGVLISRKVIEGYTQPGYIGDLLVDVMPSNLKTETIAGFTHAQGPKTVIEGMPYEDSSIGEKYVTTTTAKKGRLISISEEAIKFDQTGQLLRRARMIGEAIRSEKEETILNGVQDTASVVYAPAGTTEALYAAGNNNLKTSNALQNWTDIDADFAYHAANVKDDRQGETAKPIVWMPKIILVPQALLFIARQIVTATEVRTTLGSSTEAITANPVAGMGLQVLSSPFVDAQSTTAWYLGDFMKQFVWHEIWPLQTFEQGADSNEAFERDIIARFKVRYYGGIAATDERYVIKNTA